MSKPNIENILRLTIKKEWYDLIKSGVKTEEYREIKEYWNQRLRPNGDIKEFDFIEFKNGYSKTSPVLITECNGITIGNPKQAGANLFENDVFIISIGRIVWSNEL